MKREIKFRALDRNDGKVKEIERIDFMNELVLFKGEDGWVNFDNAELIQYTGLKDKNGKEIYEKDILKNNKTEKTGFVQWHGSMAGFILNELPRNAVCSFKWGELYLAYMKLEVIGNTKDNPELLQEASHE